jgi:hypothetical protein
MNKLYLDNDVVSSLARDDLPSQSDALDRLLAAYEKGNLQLVTSELTLGELQKVPKQYRAPLDHVYRRLAKVPIVRWEDVIFITNDGMNNWPSFDRDPLYKDLNALGLGMIDGQHVYVAAKTGCEVFLTCDGGILHRAATIGQLCGLAVQRPSEFAASHAL